MLAISTVALILSLGAAANLPSRPAATGSDQPELVGERTGID
jgi:hypothetical protein